MTKTVSERYRVRPDVLSSIGRMSSVDDSAESDQTSEGSPSTSICRTLGLAIRRENVSWFLSEGSTGPVEAIGVKGRQDLPKHFRVGKSLDKQSMAAMAAISVGRSREAMRPFQMCAPSLTSDFRDPIEVLMGELESLSSKRDEDPAVEQAYQLVLTRLKTLKELEALELREAFRKAMPLEPGLVYSVTRVARKYLHKIKKHARPTH